MKHPAHTALQHCSKDKIIQIVHRAKCGKLAGMDTARMSKEDVINHLVASKCPEVHKIVKEMTTSHHAPV